MNGSGIRPSKTGSAHCNRAQSPGHEAPHGHLPAGHPHNRGLSSWSSLTCSARTCERICQRLGHCGTYNLLSSPRTIGGGKCTYLVSNSWRRTPPGPHASTILMRCVNNPFQTPISNSCRRSTTRVAKMSKFLSISETRLKAF